MQLGIGTYTYGWAIGSSGSRPLGAMTAPELLSRAQAFGIRLVQFGDNLPLHEMTDQTLQTLRQQSADGEIALEVGARGLTLPHLDHYIRIAEQLRARLLRFVIDAPGYEPSLSEIIRVIRSRVQTLEQLDITLGIENHDRLKAREFVAIIEQVASKKVGICLDSVNSMGAGEGLEQVVDLLAPHTVNLHVKDFGIQRLSHQMGFRIDGRPAGQGMLRVPWLLQQLVPYQRCHTAILEQWVVPEDDWAATLQKEESWAAESLHYLQAFFER